MPSRLRDGQLGRQVPPHLDPFSQFKGRQHGRSPSMKNPRTVRPALWFLRAGAALHDMLSESLRLCTSPMPLLVRSAVPLAVPGTRASKESGWIS